MDISLKKRVLKKLAFTQGEDAQTALDKELSKITSVLKSETQYDILEDQLELLNIIAFRVHKKAFETISQILERLKTIELTYQELPGYPADKLKKYHNNETLTLHVLNALRDIFYFEMEKTLDILFEYALHINENIKNQAIKGLESIAKFNLDVFYGTDKNSNGLGWLPQEKIMEKILSMSNGRRAKYLTPILTCINQILSPSIEGYSSTYNTVTFKTASVPAQEGIIRLRLKGLELLKKIYHETDDIATKKKLLNTMQIATQLSRSTNRTKEIEQMIAANTIYILQFMSEIVASEDLQIMQTIEHDAYRIYRQLNSFDPDIEKVAFEINEKLKAHSEYQIFRILIGFESIFHDWKEDRAKDSYDIERKIREQKATEYASNINKQNYPEWKQRILKYAVIQSMDMATFPYFVRFLEVFGKASPKLAINLLEEAPTYFENFVAPVLRGIDSNNDLTQLSELLNNWIETDKFLLAIARYLEVTTKFNKPLLTKLFNRTKALENIHVLNQIIVASFAQHKKTKPKLIKDTIIPAIKLCTNKQNANWIFNLWFKQEYIAVLSEMDNKSNRDILNNLMYLDRIGYEAEEILLPIAKNSPIMLVEFFCDRIRKGIENSNEKFEDIPYQFSALSQPLSKIPDKVLNSILSRDESNNRIFTYTAARLLNQIFPKLEEHPAFEVSLIEMARTDDEKKLFFITDILRGYNGSESIHTVCKELIIIGSNNDELLNTVYIVLQNTGVVSGEDGLLKAYEEKIQQIEPWLKESNEDIVRFAQNYKSNLEQQIEAERKRTEERIALRKHQYGSDDD
jgi:hypothetical protein